MGRRWIDESSGISGPPLGGSGIFVLAARITTSLVLYYRVVNVLGSGIFSGPLIVFSWQLCSTLTGFFLHFLTSKIGGSLCGSFWIESPPDTE